MEEQNKRERITTMKSKTKTNKVPKSGKTRLSDLTPKQDAHGGKIAPGGPAPQPVDPTRAATSIRKKHVTL